MTYYVYKIQNKINFKVYIGKTNEPSVRFKSHLYVASGNTIINKHLLHKAIMKYGANSFDFVIIQEFDNEPDALEGEKYWINFFKSNVVKFGNKFGYNLTDGGEGISGFKHSQTSKDKVSAANLGRKFSNKTKEKMRKAHIGKPSGMLGKNHSDNKKQQQSQMVSGENNYFYNKHFNGELNHNSSLTDAEALEIIELLKTKKYKNKEIAHMYNVSIQVISKIKTGRTRTHLPR